MPAAVESHPCPHGATTAHTGRWSLTPRTWGPLAAGGSAVALATGMSALEIGSDIGASLRNPAHYCGVYSHKPTYGVVPYRGHLLSNVQPSDISVAGPMARSAKDLTVMLKLLVGADGIEARGMSLHLPDLKQKTFKDFRVAVMLSDSVSEVDQPVQDLIAKLAQFLSKKVKRISHEARPDFTTREAMATATWISSCSRGSGLVADDVVELYHIAPETLEGRSPELLKDFLEVRGLGMLNIRTIFGETAVRRKMKLRLVAHLERPQPGQRDPTERLPLAALSEEILGVTVRKVVVPVAAGRNLAVLVEAAVRNEILKLRGIDSTAEFLARQKQQMDAGEQ